MTWKPVQPATMTKPAAPYTPVVISGDHVYTSGQVALDADGSVVTGGVTEQTRQVLANVRTCLEAAGCTLADVVKVTAFLVDLADFEAYNAVYRETFAEPYPARSTVQAGLVPPFLVEIEVVARRPR
jgi:2-iminobutanoate/2-iminopropanoate deaminase